MRIETWNIKAGQYISIREVDGDTTIVKVISEPFDIGKRLFIEWRMKTGNIEYKGIAKWNEDDNVWGIYSKSLL